MMKSSNQDKSAIAVVHRNFRNGPTRKELDNIARTKREFVKNPQMSNYDSMFTHSPISTKPPKGYKQRSSLSVVIGFFVVVAIVFLAISFLLGTLL